MTEPERSLTVLIEYFYPEEASTAQLLTDLTTGLSGRFDVSVITAYPYYHDDDRKVSVPKHSTHEGVDVTRVRATRFDTDSLPRRVVNWLSFTLLVTLRLLAGRGRSDVLLVLSNPPILPLAAWVNKRLRGTPYVYLVYDMYPDMPVGLGLLSEDSRIVAAWERVMPSIYRDADRIVVLGESMERRLTEKMADDDGFDPEKIEVIPNWADGEFIEPVDKADNEFATEHGTTDRFTLLYSGNIGRFHELRTTIDAMAALEHRGRTDVQFLVIGDGARKAELQGYVDELGLETVQFLPFQAKERLPETLTCGDASLVGIKPEMEGMCVSAKLYTSLAAGLPVLAVVGAGDEVARVVREHDCGASIEPGDATAAADVIARWADDPAEAERLGEKARAVFEDRYTREHAVAAYGDLFADVAST
jgi:glycosyltransferase involved in cell wall biosynthesis